MKKCLLCGAAIAALLGANSANADEFAPRADLGLYNWNGFYAGLVAGAAWGTYKAQTSASGTLGFAPGDPADEAVINAAGGQSIKQTGFVTGIEGGYNWRSGNWLYGIEGDAQAVHLVGSAATGMIPYVTTPKAFTINSFANDDLLLTVRPRLGFVAPNNWLFYATGGLAATRLESYFHYDDQDFARFNGGSSKLVAGYAVGGGVEVPLTARLSVKADYLHVAFPNATAPVQSLAAPILASIAMNHSTSLSADLARAGLNYQFGELAPAQNSASILAFKAPPMPAVASIFKDWQLEAGARAWLSTGSYGGPQPLLGFPGSPVLVSRLTYSDLNAVSGETFARADHASGFFVKGYLGAGGFNNGAFNDEDAPAPGAGIDAYSNTLASASGHIGYATIDVGYNFLQVAGAKVGAFLGYNYFNEDINTRGCGQVAGAVGTCSPPISASDFGLTDYNQFNSLRLGLSSTAMLTDRLKLTADAAYLPVVSFSGVDNHLGTLNVIPEASNRGDGIMLEAMIDYYLTPSWSVGAGGRYWAWNMNTGTSGNNIMSLPPSMDVEAARFNAERYGAFVQTSYHWGEPEPAGAGISAIPTKAPRVLASGPMNWTGWYVGGHMGGGVSAARWSDPFPSTPGVLGATNIAGFGDKTHGTSPLGGGQIGVNWQTGQWVLGAELDASSADLRGENTCFSGLGAINCQHVVKSLGSVTGRIGYAFDRSLAYVKAGGARTDTTYNLLGNTNALTLGNGSTSMTTWGWTVGIGLEYALTNHWTTFAEYDYIGLPSTTVPFPTVAVVNVQNIGVSQAIDIFKMGVNYKFDVGPSAVADELAPAIDIAPFSTAARAMASAAHWTGFYIGGNYGALFEKASGTSNFTDTAAGTSNPQANAFSDTALLGGVQAGYNWQWDPHWLVGVEGDWDWSNGTYSFCRQTDPTSGNCFDNGDGFENIGSAIKWLGTARARLGAIWNNWLLYGTGGGALGRVDTNLTLSCLAIGCGTISITPVAASSTFSNTKMGWVAGIGAETMLWFNWSARAEWLHTDLGTISGALPTTGTPGVQTALWSRTERFDEVRLGLNYHY